MDPHRRLPRRQDSLHKQLLAPFKSGMETHGPALLQLHLRLHLHPQIHSPHRSGPHPLPGARQRGRRGRSGRALPVPPRDTPPGPLNPTGVPGLPALPSPLPLPGFVDDANLTVAHTLPKTPQARQRTNSHPTGQRLGGCEHLLPLPQQPHRPPYKVGGDDQRVCHSPYPGATRAPIARCGSHHSPDNDPEHKPRRYHRSPQGAITPGLSPPISVPGHQGPLPIPQKHELLPQGGLERLHRLSDTPPDTPHDRPPASHKRCH